ncbi:nucleotide pyrophosphohydrolase [Bdellovibrio sp. qaytius]|nr:nucleotide pyrophosphohydrolase [Bdellovibrio sp. qaytius]
MDSTITLQQLKNQIEKFCSERDWDQFHPPKDLAIGISTEANELLDLFRFKTDLEIEKKLTTEEFKNKVQHELADVFFFVLRFAQKNNIDLSKAVDAKMKLNAEKYPVETAKGSNKKYNE